MNNRIIPLLMFTISIVLSLTLFQPIEIISANMNDNDLDFSSILMSSILMLTISLVVVLLLYFLLATKKLRHILTSLLGSLAIGFWIISSFLYVDIGQLDGRGLDIDGGTFTAIIQTVVLIALLYVLLKNANLHLPFSFGIITIGLLSFSISSYTYFERGGVYKKEESSLFTADNLSFSYKKNILHIIFDEFQGDVSEYIIDSSDDIKSTLDGFTLFTDTLAVYPTTIMSLPAMFSGEVYKNNGSRSKFMNQLVNSDQSVPTILGTLGYSESSFSTACGALPDFSGCVPITPSIVLDNKDVVPHASLMDIALFKSLPDYLKHLVYNDESWLLQRILVSNKYLKTGKIGVSYKLLNEFTSNIYSSRNTEPSYKVFHSEVTHSPIWLDENCNFYSRAAVDSFENKVGEGNCALSQIKDLIDKLKAIGVYDQTLIIVSSDHGSTYTPPELKGINIPYSRSSSTLLIKPFNATGKLKYDNYPASLLDTYATTLQLEDHKESVNLLSHNRPLERDRAFYHYEWQHKYWNIDALPPLTIFNISSDSALPQSWSLEVDDLDFITYDQDLYFNTYDQDLYFNDDIAGLTIQGLSDKEIWGRWSDGKVTSISFNHTGQKLASIYFNLNAYVNDLHPEQRAKVKINGKEIGTITVKNNDIQPVSITLAIPPTVKLTKGINLLELNYETSVSPYQLGESSDKRELGFGFVSAKFNTGTSND